MPDTRDPFSSAFEDLADAGRSLARPLPANSIHVLGRTRQKQRQRFTVATSGVVACAVAAGIAFTGTSGAKSPTLSGRVSTPTPTATSKTASPSFLEGTDLPDVFQWHRDVTGASTSTTFVGRSPCGSAELSDPNGAFQAQYATDSQYGSPVSSEPAHETIYRYASVATARQDYLKLVPDVDKCLSQKVQNMYSVTASKTADTTDGFGWVQTWTETISGGYQRTNVDHFLVVRAGDALAVFTYREANPPLVGYDLATDPQTLTSMRSRLLGLPAPEHTPSAVTTSAAAPAALPDSAWIADKEIPFAAAEKSQGWVYIAPWAGQGSGSSPASNACTSSGVDAVDGSDSVWQSHNWHGNPTTVPASPDSLYSSATETIHTFNGPDGATAAFEHAKKVLASRSCSFTDDGLKALVARVVKAGPSTATGFSVAIDDRFNSTGSHQHTYVVIKGNRVAELNITFESGANNTDFSRDQAVLTTMAGHLP